MSTKKETWVAKIKTHIDGFDLISIGGLPKERTTLISGTSGSGKTVFSAQFLAEGIMKSKENGVFVTFEETPDDIRRNMQGFNWPIGEWEQKGQWAFVDASPQPGEQWSISGSFDFGALMVRIEYAVKKLKAKRLSMDSIGAVFSQFPDSSAVRMELFRVIHALKKLGVTTLITAERTGDNGELTRHGVEEFVADNVIILKNVLEAEKRRRTIEILKYRGTQHQKGEFPFSVMPQKGVVVIPMSAMELTQKSSDTRVSSGNEDIDKMCGGGLFQDSVVLVSGATGAGKTLLVTKFVAEGCRKKDKCLILGFEESRSQLTRNALGWGENFEKMEQEGCLKVICSYPEVMGLEDHLIRIKEIVGEYKPDRLAVDSLSALERISTIKGFREFVIGFTSFVKAKEITTVLTATTPGLMGGTSITEAHISTVTDSIILIRYVEAMGEIRRGMTVLKMRGSRHDTTIREFKIKNDGMHIDKPFRNINGILSGHQNHVNPEEIQRMENMFR